ncbi:MAG: GTP cyclohydrolase II [Bdellovibrio sp.]|nr:MAG: GTP cyclohydrolase II [Bdellovibrio sp.]
MAFKDAHIVLTSHPSQVFKDSPQVQWGASTPLERGPIVASLTDFSKRNAIGTHSGSYALYRALAATAGQLEIDHRPDLKNTEPVVEFGPYESWSGHKIVSLDPWGAHVYELFQDFLQKGYDIRPTIAVTSAHIHMPELKKRVSEGKLPVDGKVVLEKGDVVVTKAAVEPVWYLPGIAERFGLREGELRKGLFQYTGGMFPELITRPDIKVFLPPIGSTTVYVFGDIRDLANPQKKLTLRVHDECNGSDVFGSDICTCRPYLVHGIEEAIRGAQEGGVGCVVYFRKEGRALGEVTKFLVYNARKREGDSADKYFYRTECVAGVQDMRFQELMPDVLHWLGIQKIDRFISMSHMKHDAIVSSGIKVIERVPIPEELIPEDAKVEMEAKKAAGYFTPEGAPSEEDLKSVKGRQLDE